MIWELIFGGKYGDLPELCLVPKASRPAGPAILRFRYTLRLRSFPETTFQALALGKIPEWCLGRDEGGSDRVQVLGCPKKHVVLVICNVSSM